MSDRPSGLPAKLEDCSRVEVACRVRQVAVIGARYEHQPAVRGDLAVESAGFVGSCVAVGRAGKNQDRDVVGNGGDRAFWSDFFEMRMKHLGDETAIELSVANVRRWYNWLRLRLRAGT